MAIHFMNSQNYTGIFESSEDVIDSVTHCLSTLKNPSYIKYGGESLKWCVVEMKTDRVIYSGFYTKLHLCFFILGFMVGGESVMDITKNTEISKYIEINQYLKDRK